MSMTPPIGAWIDMLGARLELVARLGQGDRDIVLFRTTMGPGRHVPLHSHGDPECFYVLSGAIEAFVAEDEPGWTAVQSGQSVLIADGKKHALRNTGLVAADLVVATSNRLARFFQEAGRPSSRDAPFQPPMGEDIQRMLRIAQAYGYWNASPAENAAVTGP